MISKRFIDFLNVYNTSNSKLLFQTLKKLCISEKSCEIISSIYLSSFASTAVEKKYTASFPTVIGSTEAIISGKLNNTTSSMICLWFHKT